MDKNYCRLCLKKDTWNSPLSVYANGLELLSKIYLVHGIQIAQNDGFSKVICHLCLAKLEFMDSIRRNVSMSNSILNGIIGEQAGEMSVSRGRENESSNELACDKCRFVAENRVDLVAHAQLHNSVCERQCPHCTDIYYTEEILVRHMRKKHKVRRSAVEYCPLCRKVFYGTETFKRHCKQHVPRLEDCNNQDITAGYESNNSADIGHKCKKKRRKYKTKSHTETTNSCEQPRIVLKISKSVNEEDDRVNTIGNATNSTNLPNQETPRKSSQTFYSSNFHTRSISLENHRSFDVVTTTEPTTESNDPEYSEDQETVVEGVPPTNSNQNQSTFGVNEIRSVANSGESLEVVVNNSQGPSGDTIIENRSAANVGECLEIANDRNVDASDNHPIVDGEREVELIESCESDVEFDEMFNKGQIMHKLIVDGRWLSDSDTNSEKNCRKRFSSCFQSVHLHSPVVEKLMRQASTKSSTDERSLDSAHAQLASRLVRDRHSQTDSDLILSEDDWDTKRIYIDVDSDDVCEIVENSSDKDECTSFRSLMSLDSLQSEDVIEIKEECIKTEPFN